LRKGDKGLGAVVAFHTLSHPTSDLSDFGPFIMPNAGKTRVGTAR
jgi:hypothetical protein